MRQRLNYQATVTRVWRRKGEAFKSKNTLAAFKDGDSSFMILGCQWSWYIAKWEEVELHPNWRARWLKFGHSSNRTMIPSTSLNPGLTPTNLKNFANSAKKVSQIPNPGFLIATKIIWVRYHLLHKLDFFFKSLKVYAVNHSLGRKMSVCKLSTSAF